MVSNRALYRRIKDMTEVIQEKSNKIAEMQAKLRETRRDNIEEITAYKCGDCGLIHDDEDDALDCCAE